MPDIGQGAGVADKGLAEGRGLFALNHLKEPARLKIRAMGFEVRHWTGGRTKFNRTGHAYPKEHWIDAACVGERGGHVVIPSGMRPLGIKAIGRGGRQVMLTDRYGFPERGARPEATNG